MTVTARMTPARSRPSPWLFARLLAFALPWCSTQTVRRYSTKMAARATSMNHATADCPYGMTMAAVSSGPIAVPVFPPTWKVDWAVPNRPPDASRAMREASGWNVAEPTPTTAAATSSMG